MSYLGTKPAAETQLDDAAVKVAYENNTDTNEFDDAEQSKLVGIEPAADVTDSTNVNAAGAVMDADFASNSVQTKNSAGSMQNRALTNNTLLGKQTGEVGALSAATIRTIINVVNGATADAKASKAELEAAVNDVKFVTALRVNDHPSVAKAWMKYDQLTADTLQASHNVSSVGDADDGIITVNFTTNFSSVHYGISTAVRPNNRGTAARVMIVNDAVAPAAASCQFVGLVGTGLTEFTSMFASFFGDQ